MATEILLHKPAETATPGQARRLKFRLALFGIVSICALAFSACSALLSRPLPARTPVVAGVATGGPSIAISPPQASAGVYVQVVGEGWPINGLVLITLRDERGRSGILAASTADGDGQINTGFLYPISPRWLQSGSHTVLAYTADGNQQATALIRTGEADAQTATTVASPTHTATPESTATQPGEPTVTPTATAPAPSATPTPQPTPVHITDWRGEYWNNSTQSGQPQLVRNDLAVFFNWQSGAPAAGLDGDHFSARWTRSLSFDAGVYRFSVEVDDGARLFIDDRLIIDEWQSGGARTVAVDVPLSAGVHTVRLDYFERSGQALVRLWWERQETFTGWKAEYFANRFLDGQPVLVRDEPVIDFRWGLGSPGTGLPEDSFSARWQRTIPFEAGSYRFFARVDDGVRVWLGNQLILDEWQDGADRTISADVSLPAGSQAVRVEYYEHTGGALASFWWQQLPTPTPSPVPTQTATPEPTPTPSYTPEWTATPTASATPPLATAIPTQLPTATPTPLAAAAPTEPATQSESEMAVLPGEEVTLPPLPRKNERIYRVITSEDEWEAFVEEMGSLRPVGDSPPRGDKGNREKNPERSFRGEETEPPVDFEEEILFLMILEAEADKLSALSFEQILWDRETGTVVVETRVTVAFQSARRQLYAARSVPKAALPQATEFSVLFIDSQAETLAELSIESTEE